MGVARADWDVQLTRLAQERQTGGRGQGGRRPQQPGPAAAPGRRAGPRPAGLRRRPASTGSTPCAGSRPGPGWPRRSAASSHEHLGREHAADRPGPSPSGTRPTRWKPLSNGWPTSIASLLRPIWLASSGPSASSSTPTSGVGAASAKGCWSAGSGWPSVSSSTSSSSAAWPRACSPPASATMPCSPTAIGRPPATSCPSRPTASDASTASCSPRSPRRARRWCSPCPEATCAAPPSTSPRGRLTELVDVHHHVRLFSDELLRHQAPWLQHVPSFVGGLRSAPLAGHRAGGPPRPGAARPAPARRCGLRAGHGAGHRPRPAPSLTAYDGHLVGAGHPVAGQHRPGRVAHPPGGMGRLPVRLLRPLPARRGARGGS